MEVLGSDVTLAHRLLKSGAAELVGSRAYALFTEAAVAALELPLDDTLGLTERYEGLPEIHARVLDLRPA
jgi:hypothetical protein